MGFTCLFGAHRWKGYVCASCGAKQNRKLVLNALRNGIATDNIEQVKQALEAIDINERGFGGTTALISAASHNRLDMIPMLLERKADIEAADSQGHTALMHAVIGAKTEMIELLLCAGAKVNTKDRHGMTPLFHAAFLCDVKLIERLLQAGADVNAKDLTGMTALMCAASKGDLPTITTLVAAGADLSARNFEGTTAHAIAKHYLHTVAAAMLKPHFAASATLVSDSAQDAHTPSDNKSRTQRIS
jgi:ankyrin repeat protein